MSTRRATILVLGMILARLPATAAYGQTDLEETMAEAPDNAHIAEWVEWFDALRRKPINLNRSSFETLRSCPVFTPFFARVVVEERKKGGPFASWPDFLRRMRLDEGFLNAVLPFVALSESAGQIRRVEFRSRIRRESSCTEGPVPAGAAGNGIHAYQRLKIRVDARTTTGLCFEKDAGERLWNDHAVGFIETQNTLGTRRLLLGDFSVQSGHGLVMGSPYGHFKGRDPLAPARHGPDGPRGYLSATELTALRGAAIRDESGTHGWTLLLSRRRLDGQQNPDGSIRSLPVSGLHRTPHECSGRNTLSETLAGWIVRYTGVRARLEATGYAALYSRTILPEKTDSRRFDFRGKALGTVGLNGDYFWNRFHLSAEFARSHSGGCAFSGTALGDWKGVDAVVALQIRTPDFQNPHAAATGSGDRQNVQVWHAGFSCAPARKTRLGVYAEMHRRPWRTFTLPVPTTGNDVFLRLDRSLSERLSISIRSGIRRSETAAKALAASGRNLDCVRERREQNLRLEVAAGPHAGLRFRTRIECKEIDFPGTAGAVRLDASRESGFWVLEDVTVRAAQTWSAWLGCAIYKTTSYECRISAFEHDLDGAFSLPVLYQTGLRSSAVFQWLPSPKAVLSIKIGHTRKHGKGGCGKGETELAFQFDWTP